MIFRQASPDDFDDVLRVIEEGRAALASLGIDQWQNGSPSPEMIRRDIALQFTMVAVVDSTPEDAALFGPSHICEGDLCYMVPALEPGTIVGTLAFADQGDPAYARIVEGAWLKDLPATVEPGQRAAFAALHRFAVAKYARQRGVASFMVRESEKLARSRGLASLRADTHEGNIPMQRTLQACGMTRCCIVDLGNQLERTPLRIGYEKVLCEAPGANAPISA